MIFLKIESSFLFSLFSSASSSRFRSAPPASLRDSPCLPRIQSLPRPLPESSTLTTEITGNNDGGAFCSHQNISCGRRGGSRFGTHPQGACLTRGRRPTGPRLILHSAATHSSSVPSPQLFTFSNGARGDGPGRGLRFFVILSRLCLSREAAHPSKCLYINCIEHFCFFACDRSERWRVR